MIAELVQDLSLFVPSEMKAAVELGEELSPGGGHQVRGQPSVCATRLTALLKELHSSNIATRRVRPFGGYGSSDGPGRSAMPPTCP